MSILQHRFTNVLHRSTFLSLTTHVLLLLVSSAAVVLFIASQTNAISYIAPDSSEYGGAGSYTRIALSNIDSTPNITTINVPVYVDAPESAINVRATIRLTDFYYPYGRGDFVDRYRVWVAGDVRQCSAPGTNGSTSNFDLTNFSWDADNGLWVKNLTVQLVNKNGGSNACTNGAGNVTAASRGEYALVEFKATTRGISYRDGGTDFNNLNPAGRSWTAYATAGSDWFATDARKWKDADGNDRFKRANYNIQIATPCDPTIGPAGVEGTIYLRDLDSGEPDNGDYDVNVYIRDLTTGARLSKGSAPATATKYYTNDDSNMSTNNATYELTMRFMPGHKYRLEINGIFYWNILIYRLPFNNISAVHDCPGSTNGSMAPDLKVAPETDIVSDGTVLNASFIINTQNTPATTARATDAVWRDNDMEYGNGNESLISTRTQDYPRAANQKGQVQTRSETATSSPLGDYICFSWQIHSASTSTITVDDTVLYECRRIGSVPKVQIWGNDLRVGSSFSGTGTNLDSLAKGSMSANSGSWVEYAITAPNTVGLLASQSGAVNGTTDPQSEWSKLTFANTGVPSCESGFGCFANQTEVGKIPDIRGALTGSSITSQRTGPVSTADIASIAGPLNNITSSNAIVTDGTITIDQNIIYHSTGLSNSQSIPQLILVGRNINIAPNVTQVDAWLIADDTINTCRDASIINATDLRSTNCQLPLKINGPVMASQLFLRRTYTNPANPSDPAELINLRGDAYAWANRFTKQNGSWQTTYTTELPPRY